MKKSITATLVMAVFAVSAPAFAHHAVNAQFDPEKEVSLTATLSHFDNRQPHAYWTFTDAKDNSEWKFESASPGVMRRAGVKIKDDINVGQNYLIYFSPARDGSHTGLIRGITIRGQRLNF